MRAGTALVVTLLVGFGGIVGLQIAGPGPGGLIDEDDTDDSDPPDEAGEATAGSDQASPQEDAEAVNGTDADPPQIPANLTLDGPRHLETGAEGTFHGRLLVDGEPLPEETVELHADGNLSARVETNASGGYEASIGFTAEGEHRVGSTVANASLAVESRILNVTVTAPEPAPVTGAWSMLRGDVARTGARSTLGPGEGTLVWDLDTELDVRHEPAVAGGLVFFGTSGDADCCEPTFRAVNATTGEPVWNTTREHGFGSPVVGDGLVLVAAGPELIALDARDGTEDWSRSVDPASGVAPVLGEDTVYTVETPGEETTAVTARSLATGDVRWRTELGGEPETSPALLDGTVYVGLGSTMYALDVATGTVTWTHEGPATFVSAPAIDDGVVLTASLGEPGRAATVDALDAASGEALWSNTVSGEPGDAVAVHGGEVYVPTGAGWLYAFDVASGDYVLNESIEGGTLGGPAVAGDTVYVAGRQGTVVALAAEDGAQRWSFPVAGHDQDAITGSPVVVDGRLFVGVDDDCTGCTDTGLVALDAGSRAAERG